MKKRYLRNHQGFTLIEIIVVLVIIAILAAIAIPAVIGYIKDAKQGHALVEARSCFVSARATSVKEYNTNDIESLDLATYKATILKKANAPTGSDLISLTTDKNTVTQLTYCSSDDIYVTYENHKWVFGRGNSAATALDALIEKAISVYKKWNVWIGFN